MPADKDAPAPEVPLLLPAPTETEPATPRDEEPETTLTSPDLVWEEPEAMNTAPDTAPCPDTTLELPLEPASLLPEATNTSPPEPAVEEPADTVTSPP